MHGSVVPRQMQPAQAGARALVSRSSPLAPWALNPKVLGELALEWGEAYRAAQPFPHVVLDDVLPEELLDEVVAEFPGVDDSGWLLEDSPKQLKQQWRDPALFPPVIASTVALLQSSPFLRFLQQLTEIHGLIGDPHCRHGGLHQSQAGGYLKLHVDEPMQPELMLQRCVNVLLYLDRNWSPGWGGDLELWDEGMTHCARRIEPRFNRLVIFDSRGTNHGHPQPATMPPGVTRRSIALYYYLSPIHPLAKPASRWRAIAVDILPPMLTRAIRRFIHR